MSRIEAETAQHGNPEMPELAIPTFTESQMTVVAESDRELIPPGGGAGVEEPLPLAG